MFAGRISHSFHEAIAHPSGFSFPDVFAIMLPKGSRTQVEDVYSVLNIVSTSPGRETLHIVHIFSILDPYGVCREVVANPPFVSFEQIPSSQPVLPGMTPNLMLLILSTPRKARCNHGPGLSHPQHNTWQPEHIAPTALSCFSSHGGQSGMCQVPEPMLAILTRTRLRTGPSFQSGSMLIEAITAPRDF